MSLRRNRTDRPVATNGLDPTGDVEANTLTARSRPSGRHTRHHWHALKMFQISRIQRCGLDPHQDLARTGHRLLDVPQFEDVW